MLEYAIYTILTRRSSEDLSNNGLSSRLNEAVCFHNCTRDEALEYCETNHKDPASCFIIVNRTDWGEDRSYAEPLIKPEGKAQFYSGNFLWSVNYNSFKYRGSDFTRPIPICDRFEDYSAITLK